MQKEWKGRGKMINHFITKLLPQQQSHCLNKLAVKQMM